MFGTIFGGLEIGRCWVWFKVMEDWSWSQSCKGGWKMGRRKADDEFEGQVYRKETHVVWLGFALGHCATFEFVGMPMGLT